MRFAAILLCLFFALPSLAQTTATQPTGTIGIDDSTTTDAAIANRIRDILRELDGYGDVSVSVSSGIVTLQGTTLDTPTAARLTDLVNRVEGVVAIENEVFETTDVVERLNPALARFKARGTQFLAFLPLAAIGLTVFVLIVFLGFFLARLRQPWERLSPNAFIADIYRQILRLVFVIGGLVVALDIIGATALLSGILGAAGIVGLAIGFAVRDTVENFIASIMLSVRQPFRPHDTVEIDGDQGKVIRLTSRATILLSFDGNHIRIPNATVFKSRIINFSRNAERRFSFALSVGPDTDLDKARRLGEATVAALPFVLEAPEASAWIESVDDFGFTLQMAAWINQTDTDIVLARSEAIRLTQAAFDAAGFQPAAPTYRIDQVPPAAKPVDPIADMSAAQQAPAPVQPVTATADKELEKIVAQERADLPQGDLLRAHGSEE